MDAPEMVFDDTMDRTGTPGEAASFEKMRDAGVAMLGSTFG